MYLEGVKYEQNGEMLEAIKCYKRAMQLVPDIEQRMYTTSIRTGEPSEHSVLLQIF